MSTTNTATGTHLPYRPLPQSSGNLFDIVTCCSPSHVSWKFLKSPGIQSLAHFAHILLQRIDLELACLDEVSNIDFTFGLLCRYIGFSALGSAATARRPISRTFLAHRGLLRRHTAGWTLQSVQVSEATAQKIASLEKSRSGHDVCQERISLPEKLRCLDRHQLTHTIEILYSLCQDRNCS